ncbi:MAG TPA: bifunctional precorrin-2 dehydrogenase/sirohydrochlorin ferrochelatase [Acidimicrobiales bacterium]
MLPLAFKVTDKPVLVIGAGRIGTGKAQLLVDAGARVTILTSQILAELPAGLHAVLERPYAPGDLRGYSLVIAATGDPGVNDQIVDEAHELAVWLNVVDDPARSDFYFTAVHRDGDVVVSVSTEGASPALAQEIRSMIAQRLPSNLGVVAAQLRTERAALHVDGASTEGVDWKPRIRELLIDQ